MFKINALAAKKSDVMCIGGNQAFGITHTPNFKTMTTFNNDYNPELLDQELSIHELQAAAGGKSGIDRLLALPDSVLTPQQRAQRDRVREMREAGKS
mgnify:CR=1 FL=1